jgi:hypothetical protein
MRRIGIIALLFFSTATAAQAQEPGRFFLLAGAQYDAPSRTTADLGIMFALKDAVPSASDYTLAGFLAEAGLGQGGARYSAGAWAITEEGLGMDVRAVMNHTFSSPRRATPGAKYVGVEAGMTFGYIFRVSAGVAHRVGGPPAPRGSTIFTVGGGVQILVPLFKIK